MDKYSLIVQTWESYGIRTIAQLEKYLDNFRILFAYHSGKIENEKIDFHDTREIFENGKVLNYTGDTRTLFEQENQKKCYEFLKGKIIAREPLSMELIKETHRILTEGTYDERRYIENEERPGEFKKHDYVTGLHEVGSDASEVELELKELLEELAEFSGSGERLLKAATYFHVKFENIHPFADGNGRTGRTLLNYYLMINRHPPIIIYEEERRMYYDCLQEFDTEEKLNPLFDFLRYETEKTWEQRMGIVKAQKPKSKLKDQFEK